MKHMGNLELDIHDLFAIGVGGVLVISMGSLNTNSTILVCIKQHLSFDTVAASY